MRRFILLLVLIAAAVLVTSLPPTALGCAPASCGCDCAPDVDLPDIDFPDVDFPDVEMPDTGGPQDTTPKEETSVNMWVIIGPGLVILAGAVGAAYFLGLRRR